MAANCWPILVTALLGAGPATIESAPAPSIPVIEAVGAPCEPRFPFDCPAPWLHGYVQDAPAYGGFYSFRPYNYKHVFVQSQIAVGWGFSPVAPYSQQYWQREHAGQANVVPLELTPSSIVPTGAWKPMPARQR